MQDANQGPAAQEPAPYDFSQQVGYLLRRAYQRHLAIFQAESGDGQLTSVQFATLCALKDHGAQSQGELVRQTGIDQATIRGIVDRCARAASSNCRRTSRTGARSSSGPPGGAGASGRDGAARPAHHRTDHGSASTRPSAWR